MLKKYNVNINSKDEESCTALTCAVMSEHIDIIQLLVQSSAKLNFKDMTGQILLSQAAASGKLNVI